MPGTHKVTKSSSLGSVKHGPTTPLIMDQDDIIALTQNVKDFSDALAKLKTIFTEKIESGDEVKVITHERLGGVLCILKNVLQGYPALHSTDLFSSSATLIAKIKGHDYDVYFDSEDIHSFCDAIDKLALAFSSSVSEYLMGDVMPEMICDGKTKSYDNLTKIGKETQSEVPVNGYPGRQLSGEDIDSTLVHLETGLDLALQRAKAWSKYARDIMTYIEKKAQLESEYSRSLSKLVQSTKQSLTDEGFLPLQSVYYTVLNQDVDYASSCQATQTLLLTNKFVEPLASRRAEHDKVRKGVKDCWLREVKKMHDTVSNLRKAQALYANRQQDYERAREAFAKADTDKQEKRKKLEDDALHKAAEAETTYKACVAETNYRHKELEKTKGEFLAKIREQIELCDQVMRTVTVEYFQLLHTVSAPLPVQYHTLCETSKNYEVGSQFAEYVRRLPVPNTKSELFVFEPYQHSLKSHDGRKPSTQSNGSTASDLGEPSNEGSPSASPKKDKYRIPVKAWGQNLLSDTDSASGSSNKSRDSSPSSSPRSTRRRQLASSQSLEELTEGEIFKESQRGLARTMTVGDEALDVPGILKHQQGRRNTTFGVDFQEQVNILNVEIPPIITRCLAEVEKRGMEVKGLYRVSGVKSRVENLCQRFELESTVYLDDIHPNVLSSVLKQYLRHLPEPLLTFKLYPDFINTSKDVMECVITYPKGVERYKTIVLQLPVSNLKTCAVLMHHLQRVASHSDLNQMSAANLGIVFGPTLLKPYEGIASLASLVDTPHQTYCIEMLIASAQTIFGPADKYQVMHGETPVEHIPDKSPTKGNITHGSSMESETDVSKASGASSPKTNQDNIICETSVKSADITKSGGVCSLPGTTNDVSVHASNIPTSVTEVIPELKATPTLFSKQNFDNLTASTPPTITLTSSPDVRLPDTEKTKLKSDGNTTILHSSNIASNKQTEAAESEKPIPPNRSSKSSGVKGSNSSTYKNVRTPMKAVRTDPMRTRTMTSPCSSSTCSRADITRTRPSSTSGAISGSTSVKKSPLTGTSSLTGTPGKVPTGGSPSRSSSNKLTPISKDTGKKLSDSTTSKASPLSSSKNPSVKSSMVQEATPSKLLCASQLLPFATSRLRRHSGEVNTSSPGNSKAPSKVEKRSSSVTPRKSSETTSVHTDRTPRFV